jgi:hypothetical protein
LEGEMSGLPKLLWRNGIHRAVLVKDEHCQAAETASLGVAGQRAVFEEVDAVDALGGTRWARLENVRGPAWDAS